MKPSVCFIFFSWSVWLQATSMHPAKGEDEDGKGMRTETRTPQGRTHRVPSQAPSRHRPKQHQLAPALKPQPQDVGRWHGPSAASVPDPTLQHGPVPCLWGFR